MIGMAQYPSNGVRGLPLKRVSYICHVIADLTVSLAFLPELISVMAGHGVGLAGNGHQSLADNSYVHRLSANYGI